VSKDLSIANGGGGGGERFLGGGRELRVVEVKLNELQGIIIFDISKVMAEFFEIIESVGLEPIPC
jgi:hypothetical protein